MEFNWPRFLKADLLIPALLLWGACELAFYFVCLNLHHHLNKRAPAPELW